MPETYEKINYSLRPAKSVERKMLAQAFHRLSEFGAVDTYRYIGFGSTYFSDFSLFHKSLGIKNMISIERDRQNEERFEFNRPFKCIQMEWGDSNEVLPRLKWNDIRTILWLDYDSKLNISALQDIAYFCQFAAPGSMMAITVNVELDNPDCSSIDNQRAYLDQVNEYRFRKLIEQVGEVKIPKEVSGKDLSGWKKAKICRQIIANEIQDALTTRNGGRPPGSEIEYKQLFNFHYADGSRMLTTGGLIYDKGQANLVAKCSFNELPFIRLEDEEYRIETPRLTYRELRYLDSLLPIEKGKKMGKILSIPEDQLEMYAKLYKYFPTFAEAEL